MDVRVAPNRARPDRPSNTSRLSRSSHKPDRTGRCGSSEVDYQRRGTRSPSSKCERPSAGWPACPLRTTFRRLAPAEPRYCFARWKRARRASRASHLEIVRTSRVSGLRRRARYSAQSSGGGRAGSPSHQGSEGQVVAGARRHRPPPSLVEPRRVQGRCARCAVPLSTALQRIASTRCTRGALYLDRRLPAPFHRRSTRVRRWRCSWSRR